MNGLYVLFLFLILEAGAFAWLLSPRRTPRQKSTPNADRLYRKVERRRREIRQTTTEVINS